MRLAFLGLSRNRIGDEGCNALAGVLRSGQVSLRELHLWSNHIGDAGCSALARALTTQANNPNPYPNPNLT